MEIAFNVYLVFVYGFVENLQVVNYEWAKGFNMKFGLCEVELKTKRRKERKSAAVYKNIIAKGAVENQ